MTWSSWIVALALMGAEEPQQPSPPRVPNSSTSIYIRLGQPAGSDKSQCKIVVSCTDPSTPEDPSGAATGACGLFGEITANLCSDDLIQAIAAFAKAVEAEDPGKSVDNDQSGKLAALTMPMPMPKVAKPRLMNEAESQETWPLELADAVRIGLDNSEIVRVIAFGGDSKPIAGTEPTAMKTRQGAPGEETHRARSSSPGSTPMLPSGGSSPR